jgi:hypothetical protein
MTDQREPKYAYEDPAALAWGAQMVREWGKRKRLRLAAEEAAREAAPSGPETARSQPSSTAGGGDGG